VPLSIPFLSFLALGVYPTVHLQQAWQAGAAAHDVDDDDDNDPPAGEDESTTTTFDALR
jgi:hypothetical protein